MSLRASDSGSFFTTQVLSKYITGSFPSLTGAHFGRLEWFGSPVRAKLTQA